MFAILEVLLLGCQPWYAPVTQPADSPGLFTLQQALTAVFWGRDGRKHAWHPRGLVVGMSAMVCASHTHSLLTLWACLLSNRY